MNIVNDTPLPVHVSPNLGPGERPILTLVTKAVFDIVPGGTASMAAPPAGLAFADQLVDTPRGPMPLVESDVAPFKPAADVLLVGARAHAPDRRPVTEVDVRLRVGRMQKIVRVFGPRTWKPAGRFGGEPKISEPAPFKDCDLAWTEAFGGTDAEKGGVFAANPVGVGYLLEAGKNRKKEIDGQPLPRIEDPEHLIAEWTDRPPPAGFGALGRGWEPRVGLLGTYDEKWEKHRAPQPPRDFDFAFYNCAPADQQIRGYLRGDESFAVVNATREGRLDGRLPGLQPVVTIRRPDAKGEEDVTMNLDTLVLEPSALKMTLVWRGTPAIRAMEKPDVAEIRFRIRYPR